MVLPPPKHSEMGAFYLVFGPMELSAGLGYTTRLLADVAVSDILMHHEWRGRTDV